MRERIHLSEQTALELIKHGKQDWIERRQDAVEAKGKGKLVTYWLLHTSDKRSPMSVVSSSDYAGSELSDSLSPLAASEIVEYAPAATKQSLRKCRVAPRRPNKDQERIPRLVDWNNELLLRLLKRVVARRDAMLQASGSILDAGESEVDALDIGSAITDERMDIIEMHPFVAAPFLPTPVEISDKVATQLHAYVTNIAALYHDNPFHTCI
jgi:hypothetical protein